MNLFDALTDRALENQPGLAPLRPVVEKELLHHDILREMNRADLLADLTFMGGTCLRTCYGANRLSEDLDFTGGTDFRRETLSELAGHLVDGLETRYGLHVEVRPPRRERGNVDTWKLKVITRPGQKHLPAQRINIDICAIPSYERRPMLLKNRYGVDMGTTELMVNVESREEILADKIVAVALRPNRLKNRDLWDIGWLKQRDVNLPLDLIPRKVADHRRKIDEFTGLLAERARTIRTSQALQRSFVDEMKRFLPPAVVNDTIRKPEFWSYLSGLVAEECDRTLRSLSANSTRHFRM